MTETTLATSPPPAVIKRPPPANCPLLSLHVMLSQRPVRIAYIASQFPAPSETFVYREVRELRRRGWLVTAVSLRDTKTRPPELEDLRYDRLLVYGRATRKTLRAFLSELANQFMPTFRTMLTAVSDAILPGEKMGLKDRLRLIPQAIAGIGLARELLEDGAAHIHCHFAHAPTTIGMYAAMQLQVPFSFTGHANDLFQRRTLLKKKLERSAFVSCISHWHREFYRQVCPGNNAVYPVIRCGVDSHSWTEGTGESEISNLEISDLRILTVCRLVEKKGVDLLLRGLASWQTSTPWKLTIAGDGPERTSLEALSRELGLREKVEFLGAVDNFQVRNLLQSSNVFALACRTDSSGDRDGIPVALMEAMACGVPVISGDLPAIRELVVPDVSGLLVNSSDPKQWADAFNKLATDGALRASLIAGGRAMVQQEFDLETNVTRLQGMMEKTVRRNRGSLGNNQIPNIEQSSSGNTPSRKYALITPCRDEAKYARRTLDSVVTQTIRPAIWVIVDDGSSDDTPKILAEYAERYPFIKVITRADRGDRKLGGGVIDAFYTGYDSLDMSQYNYVCKLDLDLDLPQKYFQILMERMETNPRYGTVSGKPFYLKDGKAILETCGDENSVGMVKFYRTECFQQIGGFVRELMWDGIDCHRCRQMGWIAVSWHDASLQFEHLRPMGTSHKNWWTGRVRHGVGQYFMGTGPVYMLASAIFRLPRPPIVMGSVANLWGYIRSAIQRKPRYGDAKFRRFLSSYQWACLLKGKKAATEALNNRQAKVWMSEKSVDGLA